MVIFISILNDPTRVRRQLLRNLSKRKSQSKRSSMFSLLELRIRIFIQSDSLFLRGGGGGGRGFYIEELKKREGVVVFVVVGAKCVYQNRQSESRSSVTTFLFFLFLFGLHTYL